MLLRWIWRVAVVWAWLGPLGGHAIGLWSVARLKALRRWWLGIWVGLGMGWRRGWRRTGGAFMRGLRGGRALGEDAGHRVGRRVAGLVRGIGKVGIVASRRAGGWTRRR